MYFITIKNIIKFPPIKRKMNTNKAKAQVCNHLGQM